MAFLDFLRLGRKRVRPVGQNLERGLDSEPDRRKNLALKIGIFGVLVLITVAAFPRGDVYDYSVKVGETWNKETLIADFDFSIRKDEQTFRREREAVRRNTPPYFRAIPNARQVLAGHRDTVAEELDRIFEAYRGYKLNESRGRVAEARADSADYYAMRRASRLKLTNEQWQTLADSYAATVPELSTTTRAQPTSTRLDETLLQEAWELAAFVVYQGVLDVPVDSVYTEIIIVRDEQQDTELELILDEVYGLNEAYLTVHEEFSNRYRSRPEVVSIAYSFFRSIFQPSYQLDREVTRRSWQQAERRISPNEGIVEEGTIIIRKGDIVTTEKKRILSSLEESRELRTGKRFKWQLLLGQFMATFATYLFFFLYLYLLRRPLFENNAMVFLMALLFTVFVALFAFAVRVPYLDMYVVPIAIVSVLLTVMFDSRVGLFGTFTIALIGALLLQFNFEFFFATVFAGALGVHSVRDIKNRAQFFVSAGVVFAGYVFILVAAFLVQGTTTARLFSDFVNVGISSFFLVMAYPLLWVFEKTFGLSTDLTYLELSDTNRPRLKELSLNAPGTFNHSLQVANLAEAAAAAVGANALMTRVGALYHDIGKMQKPEYFVENQRTGENPHDQLKPRMSALIIASHVKEGVEMAKADNLPQQIIDFIPMHHGTSLIEFFYRRAEEQADEGKFEIRESEFRYPGPRPNSKETGILMLADGVEAASRTIENPTHRKLESLIDRIIHTRIEDGQLEHTDLTFNDLNTIKDTFLTLLLGMYHVRVKYPDQEKAEQTEADGGEGSGKADQEQGNGRQESEITAVPRSSPEAKSTESVKGTTTVPESHAQPGEDAGNAGDHRRAAKSSGDLFSARDTGRQPGSETNGGPTETLGDSTESGSEPATS